MGIRVDGSAVPAMPPDAGDTVTVKLGDTLQSIANRLGVDLNDLMAANGIKDPKQIFLPGQELSLPTKNYAEESRALTYQDTSAPRSGLPGALKGDPLGASAMKAILDGKSQGAQSAAVQKPDKPDDYVPDYPIMHAPENKLETHDEIAVKGGLPNISIEHHSKGVRWTNPSGLQEHLSELNGGKPLTDFEKNMVAGWGKGDPMTTITPILKVGAEGVQGYAITTGGSGDRVTNIYDRQGNRLAGPTHGEAGLVNEGLGPLDYIAAAMAVKGLIRGLISGARGMFAGEAAEVATKSAGRSEGEAAASSAGATAGSTEAFTETEKQAIKQLEESGVSRDYAEELIREQRQFPRGGSSEAPSWSGKPGPIGKKRYPY